MNSYIFFYIITLLKLEMKNQRNMFFFIHFVDKMIKIKLNKEHKAGLNTHRFVVAVVSHSQNPVDNKI